MSRRVGAAPFGRRPARMEAADGARPDAPAPDGSARRSLNTGTLMIVVATGFAFLSAFVSLVAKDSPAGNPDPDPVAAIGLRGSLPLGADVPGPPATTPR